MGLAIEIIVLQYKICVYYANMLWKILMLEKLLILNNINAILNLILGIKVRLVELSYGKTQIKCYGGDGMG